MEAAAAAAQEDEEKKRPLLHLQPSSKHDEDDDGRSSSNGGGWRACLLILGTELSDCLAFAGIARNLVSYLTGVLGESNVAAARDVSAWTGTCFLTPLLGAFMADSYWGRRTTIIVFLSIYAMGMITLTLSASFTTPHRPSSDGEPTTVDGVLRATVYLGLYLVALGVGGIKPCASPLGADQFDDDTVGPAARASFFNWYYFCINVGSLLASTVLVWVQERAGWWLGFAIPTATMAVALAAFVFGLRTAPTPPPAGSPITRICQVVVAAVRKRGVELPGDSSLLHQPPDGGGDHRIIQHTEQFAFLDKAAVVVDDSASPSPWRLCTVTQVEELKMLLRLSTVWPTVVFFFAVTAQMPSTFVEQGKAMDTRVVSTFAVPPATMSTFEVISILLFVPAYDAVLVPLARRVTGDRRRGISQLQRLGVGLALSALAMAYSALLEAIRLRRAAATSILWQAPAYALLGAAEVFTSVGLLEFFYDQAPDSMRSLCTAVSLVAVAAGSYLNSAIVAVVAWATSTPEKGGGGGGWIPDDLNKGRLDCFLWLMAGLSCVNLLAFVFSSMRYKYKEGC